MQMKRWLREPLIHFLALGAGLFLLFGWLDRDGFDTPGEIVVEKLRIAQLGNQFERVWQRPPTDEELANLVQQWVRQEILYREGLALGLDRNDPVTRRRVIQKMEFMSDALVDDEFTDAELQAWLEANTDTYRLEARYSFRHVYFNPQRHGARTDGVVAASRRTLEQNPAAEAGDPTLLPEAMDNASTSEISRTFGRQFTSAIADAPLGEWSGPVPSGYGLHLLRVSGKQPARTPRLEEVRAAVERDLLAERSRRSGEAFFDAVRQRYRVRVAEDVSIPLETTGEEVGR